MRISAKCIALAFALLLGVSVHAQTPSAAPREIPFDSAGGRIQLGELVLPDLQIEDPLTEIVEIKKTINTDKGILELSGTGTFLKECRIITALHVLLSIKSGEDREIVNEGESLVGDRFEFETAPVPKLGNKEFVGHFVILGHGHPKTLTAAVDAEEDWAVGYDEDCLSEKLDLGYVRPVFGQQYDFLKNRQFFTAGHSKVDAIMKPNGDFPLYVDSECGINTSLQHFDDSYLLTNCSVWHGGSGQLLLAPFIINNKVVREADGRPRLGAYGLFQNVDLRYKDPDIPITKVASGVAPFTDSLAIKLMPYLSGPVCVPNCAPPPCQSNGIDAHGPSSSDGPNCAPLRFELGESCKNSVSVEVDDANVGKIVPGKGPFVHSVTIGRHRVSASMDDGKRFLTWFPPPVDVQKGRDNVIRFRCAK